ncbi:peptidase M13, partial [Streptococcus agalactiae]|nr:peptidase M13 [Streptococcus agalactiae]MDE7498634.1 peptidase M13 [Streptococcus agalactiae]
MQRKSYLKSMSVLTLTACLISGYVVKDIAMLHAVSASEKKANNVSPRENLYRAVNDNWLANTKLKQGQTSVNSFSEIEDKLKQLLVSDMAKMASGKIETTNDEQKKMVAYYKQGMDFKTRDKNGLKPLKPVLQKLEAVSSMKDFQSLAHDFVMSGFVLPFGLTVETNARDNSQKQLVLRQAPALLESPDQYKKGNKEGEAKLSAYRTSAMALLKQAGKSNIEDRKLVKQAIAFDRLLSEKTQVDQSKITAESETAAGRYNPESMETVHNYAKEFDFKELIEKLVGPTNKAVNVED